jgi:hypothetical protein
MESDYISMELSANGHNVHPPNDTYVNMEHQCNDIDGKTEGLGENPVPVSLCPPQNPPGLPWKWTWASKVQCVIQ